MFGDCGYGGDAFDTAGVCGYGSGCRPPRYGWYVDGRGGFDMGCDLEEGARYRLRVASGL